MGNFFPMMVCGLFCVFWLSFGLLELPSLGLAASYSETGSAAQGASSVGYNAAVALYLCALGFTMFTFFIFTLKTNVVFALIFLFTTSGVFILSGAYWQVALGNYILALKLQKVFSSTINRENFTCANQGKGWRGNVLHCGHPRMVYYCGNDGCRNAGHPQPPCWRPESFVAKIGR